MPVAGGGVGKGGAEEDVSKLREAIALRKENVKAIDDEIGALGSLHPKYNDLIKARADELKAIKELKAPMEEYNKRLLKEVENINKDTIAHKQFVASLKDTGSELLKAANYIKGGIEAYHNYNLAVQDTIDQTGKFLGQSARGRQEFESFRSALNLTRQEAEKFGDIFASGLRMGVTNDNLKKMVRNLQDVQGQTKGLELAQKLLATSMDRVTLQRLAKPGGNAGAAVEALRGAKTSDEVKAITSTLRKPENRPEETREAIRFQQGQAKANAALDNIKGGIQAFVAKGVSPELAAMTTFVSGISDDVKTLVQNTGPLGRAIEGGFGKLLGKIPGLGGGAGGLMGRIFSGAGAGGAAGVAGRMLKGGLFAAAGELGGAGLDLAGEQLDKRGHKTAGKWARVGGQTARGAGYGAMVGSILPGIGTGVGAGVGAAIGGGIGIAQEFGDTILSYAGKWGNTILGWANKAGEALLGKEKADIGTILEAQSNVGLDIEKALSEIGPSIDRLPQSLKAGLAVRGAEIGVGTVSGRGVDEAIKAYGQQFDASIEKLRETVNQQQRAAEEARATAISALGPGATGPEATAEQKTGVKAIEDNFKQQMYKITQTAQEGFAKADVGKGARVAMERVDVRSGQLGEERQAAAERLKRTGAITGDMQEILKNEKVINETYAEESKILNEGRAKMEATYAAREEELKLLIDTAGDDEELLHLSLQELDKIEKLRGNDRRRLNLKEESVKSAGMEAKLENKRLEFTQYELTATYKRAQAQQTLAKAQEEFAKERGATPQEIGGFAKQAAGESQSMLDQFNAKFKQSIQSLTEQAGAARRGGNETEAVRVEQMIYDLRQKGVDLEKSAYQTRVNAATIEAQRKQEEFGVQKSILETVRDQAARSGQSWRIQMQYQSQIIQASRGELAAAEEAFRAAKEAGESGLPLMQKQLAVVQKQSSLQEATIGKQRDFLEKAIASSFGMGGGSKAQPNINPRIFGEQYKDVRGQLWQGTPKTMEQTRRAGGGNLRGNIGAGGGGINAVPLRPGVTPAAAGAAAALMGGGAMAGAGAAAGGAAKAGGVDVSGNFTVLVKFDTAMFKSEVKNIAVTAYDERAQQGGDW